MAPGKGHGGEARRYSYEPFKPGNEKALVHGARSERKLAPVAAEFEARARSMPDFPGHLSGSTRYDAEIQSWAWSEAICLLLREFLAQFDPLAWLTDEEETVEDQEQLGPTHHRRVSQTKRTQSALEMLRRWESIAGARRAALGLTPVSAGRLARDLLIARRAAKLDLAGQWAALAESEGGDGDDDDQ